MYTCTCIHTHIQEFEAARKRSEGVLEAFSVDQLYLQEDEWPGIFLFFIENIFFPSHFLCPLNISSSASTYFNLSSSPSIFVLAPWACVL